MEGNLLYTAQTSSGGTSAKQKYYNIARDLSAINGKNEEITTRDGHLYAYIVEVTAYGNAASFNQISTISNSWKVRNAFRKFHFARDHMFDQAGVTKSERGKYGQTLRPFFSYQHKADGEETPRILDIKNNDAAPEVRALTGGEWTYSILASSPTLTATVDAEDLSIPLVDEWTLHVLGDNLATSTDGAAVWDSVGMVKAYNKDRMDQTPDADNTAYPGSTLQGNNNPLAALRTQNLSTGEVIDIAQDQEEEKAPYDITDSGDSIDAVVAKTFYMSATGEASVRKLGTIVVPAGLLCLTYSDAAGSGLQMNVVGKVLCKDLA
ncbi:hypothetical protein ES705_40791 [subsurface metagenome]